MATLTEPTYATIMEDGGATMMARVVTADGTNLVQADLTGASVKVYDLNAADPAATVHTATLTIASVVFDALQTDDRWSADSTGYNFRDTRAASVFTTGGHRYRVEYSFDPTSGEDFWLIFELTAQPVRSS